MSALDRLKEKIEAWKKRIEELAEENDKLKEQLKQASGGGEEAEKLRVDLEECQATVASLHDDIREKDQEIEEIIAKVEALIG